MHFFDEEVYVCDMPLFEELPELNFKNSKYLLRELIVCEIFKAVEKLESVCTNLFIDFVFLFFRKRTRILNILPTRVWREIYSFTYSI